MMRKLIFSLILLIYGKAGAQSSALVVADSLYVLGSYSNAINEYAKVGSLEAEHQIARSYNAMGNYEKAVLQYQAVIQKNTSNLLAQFELGKIYDKRKDYLKSRIVFKVLTEKSPDNPEFHYYLGKAYQELKEYKKGNKALVEATRLDSTHLRSIFLLGKYYVSVEELALALEILDLGLQSAPNDVALINLKALAYFNNGSFQKAIPLLERLVELGETKPFVFKKLGHAAAERWEYEKAKKAYRRLDTFPNYEADASKGLGAVYFKEKQLDSAEFYFKKSIEERRYIFEDEYRSLGRIARVQKKTKKALDYYTLAWKENPDNQLGYWQVCVMADEYYKDPQIKLNHYEKLLSDFDDLMPFLKERAERRIGELKEEIHFNKN